MTLSGTNTFSGTTTTTSGSTLNIGSTLALQDSVLAFSAGSVTFGSGVTAATVGALSGSGLKLNLTNLGSSGVALTLGTTGLSSTYSGSITGSGGSLVVTAGTNTFTITGTSGQVYTDFTGGVTINNGADVRLAGQFNGSNGLGVGNITMNNNAAISSSANSTQVLDIRAMALPCRAVVRRTSATELTLAH